MHTLTPPIRPFLIEVPLPVRTYDIDFAGIVSNIVYIRWLEDLRLEDGRPIETPAEILKMYDSFSTHGVDVE